MADKQNVTNMSAARKTKFEEQMDDNGRDTSKASLDFHMKAFKTFANYMTVEEFKALPIDQHMKNYCEDDDKFKDVEIKAKEEKPKRTLSPEHLAKMQEGRRKKAEEKKAAAAAAKDESEKEESEKEEEEKPKPAPKTRKPKAAAH